VGVLHRFEQRLEHIVTGAFARAFRSAVQPVEIAAALQREIDNSAQILSRDRLLAPNSFHVELSEPDFDRLAPYGDALSAELATLVREHVSEQRYTLAGPLDISFGRVSDLSTGRFRVRSRANAEVTPMPGQQPTGSAPVILEVNGKRHPLHPPGIVVGRGSEAGLRINDPGVSRKHVEIRVDVSGGQVTVSAIDLGSTNGTSMDGRRVQQALLRDGSTIVIGNTTMVVRDPTALNERSG
jgi:hypothetical protein